MPSMYMTAFLRLFVFLLFQFGILELHFDSHVRLQIPIIQSTIHLIEYGVTINMRTLLSWQS